MADTVPPKTLLLGVIIGAQGIRGEVKVKTFTGDPEAIGDYGPLRDARGQRSFQLKVHRLAQGDVVVASIKIVGARTPADRSEERRVGNECYSPCRSRWLPST